MATGNTLSKFFPTDNRPPATNYATPDRRNGHDVLDFDDTTAEGAVFTDILPRNYAGGGITVYVHWSATSATTGNVGWTVEFEADSVQDIDSDGFASAQTVAGAAVNATSGKETISILAVSNGANIDSIVVGERFRLRLKRDVAASGNATGDAEFSGLELKET